MVGEKGGGSGEERGVGGGAGEPYIKMKHFVEIPLSKKK
jgi:hypothetical protein